MSLEIRQKSHFEFSNFRVFLYNDDFSVIALTLKAPITTAADEKFCDNFPIFDKNKVWYYMRIVSQQTILM